MSLAVQWFPETIPRARHYRGRMDIAIEPDEIRAIIKKAERSIDQIQAANDRVSFTADQLIGTLYDVPAVSSSVHGLFDRRAETMSSGLRSAHEVLVAMSGALDDFERYESETVRSLDEIVNPRVAVQVDPRLNPRARLPREPVVNPRAGSR